MAAHRIAILIGTKIERSMIKDPDNAANILDPSYLWSLTGR